MIEQYVDMNAKLYRISCVNISFNTCTLDWRSACDSCLICSLPRFVAKVSCSLSVVGIIHVPATRRMAADWTSLRSAAVVSTAPRAICAYNGLAWELPQIHSHMPPPPPAENMSKKELRGISLNDVLVKKRSLLLPSLPTWPRSPWDARRMASPPGRA